MMRSSLGGFELAVGGFELSGLCVSVFGESGKRLCWGGGGIGTGGGGHERGVVM